MIEIRDMTKVYNTKNARAQVNALDGVSLTIESGEMVAIVGASGAGKSTLMHMIGCLDTPTSGEYLLDGAQVDQLKNRALARLRNQKFGFVLQNFGLINDATAVTNVGTPLMFSRTPLRQVRLKALEAMRLLGIERLAQSPAATLSGGEKQRTAIARALVNDPDVILADEPTGALDTKNAKAILGVFKKLNAQGKTVIIVTHDPYVARQCGRIVLMSDGKIVEDKTNA